MKIVANNGQAIERAATRSEPVAALRPAADTAATERAASVLGAAQAELAALPEIDQAKVDALREALARGEIGFDADRLARLIQRFHGGGR
jgi:negative regulator of flagellin synthesis FlgM